VSGIITLDVGFGVDEYPICRRPLGPRPAGALRALERARDNRTLAARLLGVSRRTFYNRLREHGLD